MDKGSGVRRKKPVPKFSSFRPKPSASVPEQNTGRGDTKGHEHDHKKQRRHDSEPREEHYVKDRDTHSRRNLGENLHPQPSNSPKKPLEDPRREPKTFVIDRSGDLKNLEFGSIDQYSVPRYFRTGGGRIIGAGSSQRIDLATSTEKRLILTLPGDFNRPDRHNWKSFTSKILDEQMIQKENLNATEPDRLLDFLPLERPRKRRRYDALLHVPASAASGRPNETSNARGSPSSTEIEDSDTDDYRGDGSSKAAPQSGNETESYLQKQGLLSRAVESNPKSGKAWFDLINHQGSLLGRKPTMAEKQSTGDIKLSMYQKALGAVDDQESKQELATGMMQEAVKFWDSQRLSSEWRKLLQSYPSSQLLWARYLDFRQTDFSSFKFEAFRTICADTLEILLQHLAQKNPTLSERDYIYQIQIFIIMRITLCMRESGFHEHAVGVWQALLEFEYFAPSKYLHEQGRSGSGLENEKFAGFEAFWESEVLRIGEAGAKGWSAYASHSDKAPDPKTIRSEETAAIPDPFTSWLHVEEKYSTSSLTPARTTDETPENDPFRVILYSDIRPFLVSSPSKEGQKTLLQAFLYFCQLPISGIDIPSRKWSRTGVLHNEELRLDQSATSLHEPLGESAFTEVENDRGIPLASIQPPFNLMVQDFQQDTETLFAKTGSWFSAFKSELDNEAGKQSLAQTLWGLGALQAIVFAHPGNEDLAEYALALELSHSPDSAKKTARRFLKSRPSSLRLYNAYSLIEYRLGNVTKADQTLHLALNMVPELDEHVRRDRILLWHTWAWECLNEDKLSKATNLLLMFDRAPLKTEHLVESERTSDPSDPSAFIHSEKELQLFRDQMLIDKSYRHAILASECLILLTYLAGKSDMQKAIQAFEVNVQVLTHNECPETFFELFYQSTARLIYYNATHSAHFKPSDNRHFLSKAITQFPQNTIFLSLYAWNESRFRVRDRLRSLLEDLILNVEPGVEGKENVVSHFFAIHSELKRGVLGGSNDNTIRATIERAVESEVGAHSPGLWKTYFHFEYSRGDMKKAKAVFYRSIKACPWVKELYLLPFEYLRSGKDALGYDELKGIYELMVAKELRIHVDLDEMIDDREEAED